MSDTQRGAGSWQASDGKWYPNESHPTYRPPPPPGQYPPVYEQRPGRPDQTSTTPFGASMALIGGILIAGGVLLPWLTIRLGLGILNRTGMQLGQNLSVTFVGPLLLALGVLTVVIGIARLVGSAMPRYFRGSTVVTGLLAAGYLISNYPSLSTSGSSASTITSVTVGYGYWVCAVGAGLAVIGGIVVLSNDRSRRRRNPFGVAALVVLLLILGVVGADAVMVSRRHTAAVPVAATITTQPPIPFAVRTGCGAIGQWSAILAGLPPQSSPSDFQAINTGQGSSWSKVTSMEFPGGGARYAKIGNDTRGFIQAYSLAATNGDPVPIQEATATVILDCNSLTSGG